MIPHKSCFFQAINVGDVIVCINNQPCGSWTFDAVVRKLERTFQRPITIDFRYNCIRPHTCFFRVSACGPPPKKKQKAKKNKSACLYSTNPTLLRKCRKSTHQKSKGRRGVDGWFWREHAQVVTAPVPGGAQGLPPDTTTTSTTTTTTTTITCSHPHPPAALPGLFVLPPSYPLLQARQRLVPVVLCGAKDATFSAD